MQLIVKEITLPEALEFNYEELKTELSAKVECYKTIAYTEDMIKQAKADRSSLNKLKKSLNDERIRLEKDYLAPFQEFKNKIAELCGIIDEAASCVDKQVKDYEQIQKEKKYEEIKTLFGEKLAPEFPWLTLDRVFDQKWLNASVKMSQIEAALGQTAAKITADMAVLSRLPEYSFEAQECYKSTLNVESALFQADNLKQMAEAKAKKEAEEREKAQRRLEEEANAAAAEAVAHEIAQDCYVGVGNDRNEAFVEETGVNLMEIAEAPTAEISAPVQREWVGFKALLSYEDALALSEFFNSRGIQFEQIAI